MSSSTKPNDQGVDPSVSRRFSAQRTSRTTPEMQLRTRLHTRGLRYRTEFSVPGLPRRRVDIAFTRVRLAVLVDGCFWHFCPEHGVLPKTNREWWLAKFEKNRARDRDTDVRLEALGWSVLRIWEHTSPESAADQVERLYRALLD